MRVIQDVAMMHGWVNGFKNCGLTWRPTTASSAALAKKMLGCMNTDVAMSRDFLPAERYEDRGEERQRHDPSVEYRTLRSCGVDGGGFMEP